MTSRALTWGSAYYPLLDREDFTVEEALRVRAQNAGEYRENPCYNSKKAFEEGLGIQLTPVNMGGKKVNFFRSFPGQRRVRSRIANSVGMGSTSSAKYTDSAIRVKSVIDFLSNNLEEDEIAIDGMLLLSAKESGHVNSLLHPDIIISHRGDYSRRETRVFVEDKGRKPEYEALPDDWILVITKFAPDRVTSWKGIRPLFMTYWKQHEAKRGRNLASELERIESEEARKTLEDILDDLQFHQTSKDITFDQSDFNREINLRLENGGISSDSVADKIRHLFLLMNEPATFVNGNGKRVPWYAHGPIQEEVVAEAIYDWKYKNLQQ